MNKNIAYRYQENRYLYVYVQPGQQHPRPAQPGRSHTTSAKNLFPLEITGSKAQATALNCLAATAAASA